MVELAREAVGNLGVNVQLVDGVTLPFSDSEFDSSLTVTVLMHNPASRAVQLAAEMARVTSSSIYVIEDTVAEATHSDEVGEGEHGQVFPRTAAALADFFLPHGFELASTERLQTLVSLRAHSLFVKLFDRERHDEGEPYPRAHWIAGRLTLPITRVADRFVKSSNELTMLHLRRR